MHKDEFIDKYYVERKNTNSLKWDMLDERFGDPDLIPMWVADMEFKTPEGVVDAITDRVQHGVFGYSFVPDSYYETFSHWMKTNFNYEIKKEWCRPASGVVAALYWFMNCYTKPEDAVIITPPVYYPFHNVVKDNGRKLITVDMEQNDGKFELDFDAFEQAIADNEVKLFIMCSPHNPAGRVWTEDELDRMLGICQKHNVLVIADEIHMDFTFAGHKHIPAPIVSGGKYADNIVLVNSSSKSFNLPGLVHANIVIKNDGLRELFDDYASKHIMTEVNILGHVATEAAYTHGEDWLDGLKNVVQSNYDYVKSELNTHVPEITVCDMEGTYLPMLDLRGITNPENVKAFVQDKCNLAVDYGEWFGSSYKGYIRFNLATHPEFVEQSVNNIIEEYNKLKCE